MSQDSSPDRALPRVLVVDDNSLMRIVLSSLLIHRGYQVVEESSSETALVRLKDEDFDLVILDIMMFKISGIDLCQIIREDLGLVDLPVVAYTANADIANVAHMRMAGFTDFLFKPVDGKALDTVLQELHAVH